MDWLTPWVHMHAPILDLTFVGVFGVLVVVDLYLVLVRKTTSISARVWGATKIHPTLYSAGTLACFAVCYLVQDVWELVMLAGFLFGHLFAHR